MHFNFAFTAVQVLWTLTFAAHLVLLVVLLGRDRTRRFPWFTTGHRAGGTAPADEPAPLWPHAAAHHERHLYRPGRFIVNRRVAGGGGVGPPRLWPRVAPRLDRLDPCAAGARRLVFWPRGVSGRPGRRSLSTLPSRLLGRDATVRAEDRAAGGRAHHWPWACSWFCLAAATERDGAATRSRS